MVMPPASPPAAPAAPVAPAAGPADVPAIAEPSPLPAAPAVPAAPSPALPPAPVPPTPPSSEPPVVPAPVPDVLVLESLLPSGVAASFGSRGAHRAAYWRTARERRHHEDDDGQARERARDRGRPARQASTQVVGCAVIHAHSPSASSDVPRRARALIRAFAELARSATDACSIPDHFRSAKGYDSARRMAPSLAVAAQTYPCGSRSGYSRAGSRRISVGTSHVPLRTVKTCVPGFWPRLISPSAQPSAASLA